MKKKERRKNRIEEKCNGTKNNKKTKKKSHEEKTKSVRKQHTQSFEEIQGKRREKINYFRNATVQYTQVGS